jgi:hypothetical protein
MKRFFICDFLFDRAAAADQFIGVCRQFVFVRRWPAPGPHRSAAALPFPIMRLGINSGNL